MNKSILNSWKFTHFNLVFPKYVNVNLRNIKMIDASFLLLFLSIFLLCVQIFLIYIIDMIVFTVH